MEAATSTSNLIARYYYGNQCYSYSYGYYTCNSTWNRWGRWVLLGCLIVAAFLIFFLFSCITARRRRKMGYNPYPMTGWTLGRNNNNNVRPQQEQPYYNNSNNPPPAYNAPNHGGAANDYYGGNVELQQPGATYNGYNSGQAPYQPPPGKPPGRY